MYTPLSKERLVRIGLTEQAADVYRTLLATGPLPVRTLATRLRVFPHALYRVLRQLESDGFVTRTAARPVEYSANPASLAVEAYVRKRVAELNSLKSFAVPDSPQISDDSDTRIELVGGKDALFEGYVTLAQSAVAEIMIVSLGEPVSERILLVNRDCIERGVRIRFLVHRYDSTNRELLSRWIRMGLDIRYRQGTGFHLVVVDSRSSLLSVSSAGDPGQRVTLQIHSRYLSQALSDYFLAQWQQATTVTGE